MKKKIPAFLLVLCLSFTVCLPVLAAGQKENESADFAYRIPTATVQARLAGGTDYLDKYGVTREKVVKELSAHENDNFYLNTPFVGGDWQSPRGDTSYNGRPGTNCAGFVAYVLRKCGLNVTEALKTMKQGNFASWNSGLFADGLSSASNYMSLAEKGKIISYVYSSKEAMLAGGKLEKGDLILRFWTDSWGGYDEDNHLMIFWGNTSSEDKVWQNASGRLHIGTMWSGNASSFIVIKFAPSQPPAPIVAGFRDVHEDDWFADGVASVKEAGLMSGITADQFSPNTPVTRGQAAAILWRLSGRPQAAETNCFEDVDPEDYYAPAVDWAVSQGIVVGRSETRFAPDWPVARQDLAAMLYRYWVSLGNDPGGGSLEAYRDLEEVSGYALPAMEWTNASGLIAGTSPDTLSPLSGASRCQAAVIFTRFLKLLEQTAE